MMFDLSVEAGLDVRPNNRGYADPAAVCIPCEPVRGRNSSRSSNHGSGIAADDLAERSSYGNGDNTRHPTPQNLRDNPERHAKVKTEICHFYEVGGAQMCPWGAACNYAHGKQELKFRYTTLRLMESSGQIANARTYLARPCMTWVSTGACPYGRRCAAIHDPSISASEEYPSWLPAATSKTNAQIIVDRFSHFRESAVHQESPLIAQNIWENCRPSQHVCYQKLDDASGSSGSKSILHMEQEWSDTYALVCNSGVPVFTGGRRPPNESPTKLSHLQKLCIVRLMHSSDGFQQEASSQLHRDFVFSPTHSIHSELCMILQERYFLLLDVNFTSIADVSRKGIVKEMSAAEYNARTTPWSSTRYEFDSSKCITAHEVAFAPKGDHTANVSIWFDARPIKLEQSQIKRSRRCKQKKKAQIRNEHTRPNVNGALIARTSSADFPNGHPTIDPFVHMLPAEDSDDIHHLIMGIIEHRIFSIISCNCSSEDAEQKKLHQRMKQLKEAFLSITKFHERWTWPKRAGMEDVSLGARAPPGNSMPYIPMTTNKKSPCLHTWHSFVKNVGTANAHANHSSDATKRLSVFLTIEGTIPRTNLFGNTSIPFILPNVSAWWNVDASDASSLKKAGTGKENFFGLPDYEQWEAALRVHNTKKREGPSDIHINKAKNMPLSTIPFVQA